MKIDTYTRIILTVIAINLCIITVNQLNLVSVAQAGQEKAVYSLPTANYGIMPLNEDGTVDVNIKSFSTGGIIDVNIKEIGGYSTYGEIEVKIKDQPIEVEIEE